MLKNYILSSKKIKPYLKKRFNFEMKKVRPWNAKLLLKNVGFFNEHKTTLDFLHRELKKWEKRKYKNKGWKTRRKNKINEILKETYRLIDFLDFNNGNNIIPIDIYEDFGGYIPYSGDSSYSKLLTYLEFYYQNDYETFLKNWDFWKRKHENKN